MPHADFPFVEICLEYWAGLGRLLAFTHKHAAFECERGFDTLARMQHCEMIGL